MLKNIEETADGILNGTVNLKKLALIRLLLGVFIMGASVPVLAAGQFVGVVLVCLGIYLAAKGDYPKTGGPDKVKTHPVLPELVPGSLEPGLQGENTK
jgi:uncharacterized membrane protein (DUF4010 family)